MRRIAFALSFGIALITVSACAPLPGGAGGPTQTSALDSCSWLEGYPDCRPAHTVAAPRASYASTSEAAGS